MPFNKTIYHRAYHQWYYARNRDWLNARRSGRAKTAAGKAKRRVYTRHTKLRKAMLADPAVAHLVVARGNPQGGG